MDAPIEGCVFSTLSTPNIGFQLFYLHFKSSIGKEPKGDSDSYKSEHFKIFGN